MFFLDKDSPDNKSGNNIFISSIEGGKETVTSARTGRVVVQGDSQYLLLKNGQRLEGNARGNELKISEFEEYGNRIGAGAAVVAEAAPAKARSTFTLLTVPTALHLGELAWRMGLALAAVNFVLIAMWLAKRHNNWTLRSLLRRSPRAQVPAHAPTPSARATA